MNKNIYLDYAATTPTDESVLSSAMPYFTDIFYNPSSAHAAGQKASQAVERAREKCANAINAAPNEIYFTSGGTEAVNQAMLSVIGSNKKHVVISAIEHDAVMASAKVLENNGFTVDTVKPTADGTITPEALKKVIRDDTVLVCVMTVNNITGVIQPIKELASVAHDNGALFFTDAVQAVNSVKIDVKDSNADMLCVSAHKFYGLKGAGFLYVKSPDKPRPLISGGEQERGVRAGTHNTPAIVAMGEAIERAQSGVKEYAAQTHAVVQAFLGELKYGEPINCQTKTNDIISIVFDGVNGGRLAVALSCAGVYCSVGSACSAGSATPPPTLVAMGVKNADCAVRFSFGKGISTDSAKAAARIVNETVARLNGKN
ncbi:MAG: cysteine desulfurase [Clostridiales bacterium]|nr:cysteine desulfurase [Clostridiales bacterium]